MSPQFVTTLFIFVSYLFLRINGQEYSFEDAPEERCMTPDKKPGECVPVQGCPFIYEAIKRRLSKHPDHEKYLTKVLCRIHKNVPIVCCEKDAGLCHTPNNDIGVCVPINRCTELQALLFLGSTRDSPAIKSLECHYNGLEQATRYCCPLFKTNTSKENNINDAAPITPPVVQKLPFVSPTNIVSSRLSLPVAGEDKDQCGIQDPFNRIINGNRTGLVEFPWMALLVTGNGDWACGGSLIHGRYVLTAAHCVVGPEVVKKSNVTKVRLGEWDLDTEIDCVKALDGSDCILAPVDLKIEEIIVHPEFNIKNLDNDIALLRLEKPAPIRDSIKIICLPVDGKEPLSDQYVTAAGWGATEYGHNSNVKLYVNMPIYEKQRCIERYKTISLRAGHVCTGGAEIDNTCTGDSGGPIIFSEKVKGLGTVFYQYAIVSFQTTVNCGYSNTPTVHTKVGYYIDWIKENMRP